MLASNVLKLRLDRIEQQGHHLSAKDQLKLVTLEQPELTAGLYTHLFTLLCLKAGIFHNTAEEINSSLRLIKLINQVFIPAYNNMPIVMHGLNSALHFVCSMQMSNIMLRI
jgi:hypothetical protein